MNRDLSVRRAFAGSAAAILLSSGSVFGAPTEAHSTDFEGVTEQTDRSTTFSPRDLTIELTDAERAEAARLARAAAQSARGLLGPVLMRHNLEAYSVGPLSGQVAVPSFLDPPGFPWGVNRLSGQAAPGYATIVDLSGAPLVGSNGVSNATKAIRLLAVQAQEPGSFIGGATMRWTPSLVPGADQSAIVSAEKFISTDDELFTFETISTQTGFVTARMLWGGSCVLIGPGGCEDIGLPLGPIPNLHYLGIDSVTLEGTFKPARFCVDALGAPIVGCTPPGGVSVGGLVPVPVNNWVRMSWEFTPDARMVATLDLQDGAGPVEIARDAIPTLAAVDRITWNASFESLGSTMHIDNIEASGYVDTDQCLADVNGDGVINFADLNIVLSGFGATGGDLPGDANVDGVVDFTDLNIVLSEFGEECD